MADDYVSVHTLNDRFEADLIMDALEREDVPAILRPFVETAYTGLFVPQKGWGRILVPEEMTSKAKAIIEPLVRDLVFREPPSDTFEIDFALWEKLRLADPESVRRNARAEYDCENDFFTVPFLGVPYRVFPEEEIIQRLADAAWQEDDYELKLLLLHYLLEAEDVEFSRKWIGEKDIPSGESFFQGPRRLPTEDMERVFGYAPELFRTASERIGGAPVELGDAAYRFWVLPRIPVLVILWEGNEEFEPEIQLLFDGTIDTHLKAPRHHLGAHQHPRQSAGPHRGESAGGNGTMTGGGRVISLAPTQTEIVAALGQIRRLAGVTENCDFPEAVKQIPTFGSWYAPDLNSVLRARPDLVCTFGSHQEEMRDMLEESNIRVYHSAPGTVADSLATFIELADILKCAQRGRSLVRELDERLARVDARVTAADPAHRPSVLRIMHWDPFITVGPGAFQHDAIERAGGRNVMADGPSPYFACDPSNIRARNPDVIFFCEPFIKPLLEHDVNWRKVNAVRNGRVHVFDCGLTCRSGPRIVDMVEHLAGVLD